MIIFLSKRIGVGGRERGSRRGRVGKEGRGGEGTDRTGYVSSIRLPMSLPIQNMHVHIALMYCTCTCAEIYSV